jgi:hypothetical protein
MYIYIQMIDQDIPVYFQIISIIIQSFRVHLYICTHIFIYIYKHIYIKIHVYIMSIHAHIYT